MRDTDTWDDIIEENDAIHKVYLEIAKSGEVTPEALLDQCPSLNTLGKAKDFIENEKVWEEQMERK